MLTSSRQTVILLICGILSGGIFSVSVYGTCVGLLSLFLPALPLALPGLAFSARHGLGASLIACALVALLLDSSFAILFLIAIACPVYYLLKKLLLQRGEEGAYEWYPVLTVLTEMTVIAAGIFMMFALFAANSDPQVPIAQMIWKATGNQLDNPDPQIAHAMQAIARDWSFLIYAFICWIWVLCLYGTLVFANTILSRNNMCLRESLAISENGLPLWLLAIIAIAVGLTVFEQGNDQFAGQTVFLILLLPYFLS